MLDRGYELKSRAEKAVADYEASMEKLHRPDGTRRYSEEEHKERESALRSARNTELDAVESIAGREIDEAQQIIDTLQSGDPTTLEVSSLSCFLAGEFPTRSPHMPSMLSVAQDHGQILNAVYGVSLDTEHLTPYVRFMIFMRSRSFAFSRSATGWQHRTGREPHKRPARKNRRRGRWEKERKSLWPPDDIELVGTTHVEL